jgi:hypothetical protein
MSRTLRATTEANQSNPLTNLMAKMIFIEKRMSTVSRKTLSLSLKRWKRRKL